MLNSRNVMTGRIIFVALLALIIGLTTGCAKSYVDPNYRKVGYNDLNRRQEPLPANIQVEFRQNGSPTSRATKLLRKKVDRFFDSTGIFKNDPSGPELKIVLNNVGDIGAAAAKGFGTGLTFGLVGTMVTDGYVLTADFTPDSDQPSFSKEYRHAIHTTIGNKAGPAGLEPLNIQEAFDTVLEDMLLNFLGDLEENGYLE